MHYKSFGVGLLGFGVYYWCYFGNTEVEVQYDPNVRNQHIVRQLSELR